MKIAKNVMAFTNVKEGTALHSKMLGKTRRLRTIYALMGKCHFQNIIDTAKRLPNKY